MSSGDLIVDTSRVGVGLYNTCIIYESIKASYFGFSGYGINRESFHN